MMINILGFIISVSIVVFIHELGHYIAARICKVNVEEFSIGFGKVLFFYKDKRDTIWKICILPFGGFVKLKGFLDDNSSNNEYKDNIVKQSNNYSKLNNIHKAFILILGPVANFILAFFIFLLISLKLGIPYLEISIKNIIKGGAGEYYGLKKDDILIEINDNKVKNLNDIVSTIKHSYNQDIKLTILRNSSYKIFNIKLDQVKKGGDKKIGVLFEGKKFYKKLNVFESIYYSFTNLIEESKNILFGILSIFNSKDGYQKISGIGSIAVYSGKTLQYGIFHFLNFIGLISINVGILNLMPIPNLDGGRLIQLFLGKLPYSRIFLPYINKVGMLIIFFIFVISFLNDIRRWL